MEDILVNGSFSQQSDASNLSEVVSSVMAPAFVLRISNAISISALILNVIHIAVVASMPKTKFLGDSNFKVFVIYLSAMNIVMMILQTSLDFESSQFFMLEHRSVCVLSATILHSSIVFSGWLLLLVSVERLIATFTPHDYQQYFYTRKFGWPLALTHGGTVGAYVTVAVVFYDKGFSVKGSGCCQMGGPGLPQLGIMSFGQGFLILLVISVLYTILLCRGHQALANSKKMSQNSKKREVVLRRLNITIGAILASKIIGWLPIMIMIILRTTPYNNVMLDYVGRISLHSFSIMSPIAYGVTSSRYRKFIIKALTTVGEKRGPSTKSTNSDNTKKLPGSLSKGEDRAAQYTVATLDDSGCYANPIQVEDSITSFNEIQLPVCDDDERKPSGSASKKAWPSSS